jgi:hypothetical protein
MDIILLESQKHTHTHTTSTTTKEASIKIKTLNQVLNKSVMRLS